LKSFCILAIYFSTSYFHRWKDGSCIEVSPVKYDKLPGATNATGGGGQGAFDFDAALATVPTGAKPSMAMSSSNQEAEHLYTFYDDIRYIPEIHEIASATQIVVQNTINNMKKFLLKFRNFKHLWRTDKVRKLQLNNNLSFIFIF
jgi:hypothetical protein